jgi:hypothetical protein
MLQGARGSKRIGGLERPVAYLPNLRYLLRNSFGLERERECPDADRRKVVVNVTRRELVKWLEAHPMDLAKMAVHLWPVEAGIISVEDAVQEGLRRIFDTENYRAMHPGVKISTWLMKSVKSAALNAADKRSSAEQPGFKAVGHEEDVETPPDDDVFYPLHGLKDSADRAEEPFDIHVGGIEHEVPLDPEELAEQEAFRQAEAARDKAQDSARIWTERQHRTWLSRDGRVVATTDPLQTVGNLRTYAMEASPAVV